jgi:four helix bundle protein
LRFIRISVGPLYECQTQLEIARNIEYIKDLEFDSIFAQSKEIEALLRGLEQKLEQR